MPAWSKVSCCRSSLKGCIYGYIRIVKMQWIFHDFEMFYIIYFYLTFAYSCEFLFSSWISQQSSTINFIQKLEEGMAGELVWALRDDNLVQEAPIMTNYALQAKNSKCCRKSAGRKDLDLCGYTDVFWWFWMDTHGYTYLYILYCYLNIYIEIVCAYVDILCISEWIFLLEIGCPYFGILGNIICNLFGRIQISGYEIPFFRDFIWLPFSSKKKNHFLGVRGYAP